MKTGMKTKICALFLIFVMVVGTAGCGSGGKGGSDKTSDKEPEDFNIVLDWYPNAIHAFIYAAIENGYFEQEGLKVNILFPSNPNDGLSMPAAGKADLGIYYLQDSIAAKYNENVPIVCVGALLQNSLNVVLSLKEKNISSPKDLIGKKVGYAGTALSEAEIEANMENVGASVKDIEFIDVGFDLLTAMTTGKVDATIGSMVNHEVPQLEEQGFKVNYFYPTDYGIPDYYELVLLAGEDEVRNNPEKLQKFLRAAQKGFEFTKENPDKALQILLAHQNKENFPLSETVEKKSLAILLPDMETENAAFLSQDVRVWQKSADWMTERKILDKKVDCSDIVVDLLK